MKRIGVVLLIALSIAGVTATGVSAAPGPAQLQRQINALKNRVNALERYVDFLKRCDSVIPVSSFGNSTEGYLYGTETSGILTSALDYDDSGTAPQYWVTVTDSSCVEASRGTGFQVRVLPPPPHGWAKLR
jgi:hypothetical protein